MIPVLDECRSWLLSLFGGRSMSVWLNWEVHQARTKPAWTDDLEKLILGKRLLTKSVRNLNSMLEVCVCSVQISKVYFGIDWIECNGNWEFKNISLNICYIISDNNILNMTYGHGACQKGRGLWLDKETHRLRVLRSLLLQQLLLTHYSDW